MDNYQVEFANGRYVRAVPLNRRYDEWLDDAWLTDNTTVSAANTYTYDGDVIPGDWVVIGDDANAAITNTVVHTIQDAIGTGGLTVDWDIFRDVVYPIESRPNVIEYVMEEDRELFDEHGGILDEFLNGFSEKKENE